MGVYFTDLGAIQGGHQGSFCATSQGAAEFVDADKLYPGTNCDMATLLREVAHGKLRELSAGAAIVRKELEAQR